VTPLPSRAFTVLSIAFVLGGLSLAAIAPEILVSADAIPPELAGRIREAAGFQTSAAGDYYLVDRGGHTVYRVDRMRTRASRIVDIGGEPGRIIQPSAFSVASDGSFVVADAPDNRARVQIFSPIGVPIGGFYVHGRYRPRIVLNGLAIGGITSLHYTGDSILMSDPDMSALVAEYSLAGDITRLIGSLRRTGHEDDPDLHAALNAGLPLVDPTGGFYFVFQTGEPLLRKYDAAGALVWERQVQGREIDGFVNTLPTTWPRRRTEEGELPLVTPTVRAAAVDAAGRLWVSFVVPYTYVFDGDGDKIRVVQFRGAGITAPGSLFFSRSGRLLTTPGLLEFEP
jgi:hypothetical protein